MTTPAFVKQSNEAKRPESHYRSPLVKFSTDTVYLKQL